MNKNKMLIIINRAIDSALKNPFSVLEFNELEVKYSVKLYAHAIKNGYRKIQIEILNNLKISHQGRSGLRYQFYSNELADCHKDFTCGPFIINIHTKEHSRADVILNVLNSLGCNGFLEKDLLKY